MTDDYWIDQRQAALAHDLDVLRVRNESIRMALAMHARRMADYLAERRTR